MPEEILDLWESKEELNPTKLKLNERPLAVLVHGGPHGCSCGNFLLTRIYFLLQGYTVLLPNFTGSAGFG